MPTYYFAAVDMDCDGPSTTIYRIRTNERFRASDTMPADLWNMTFGGSHYFNADELFTISQESAEGALAFGESVHGGLVQFFNHGAYESFSMRGIWRG